jgi:transposase
MRVELPDTRSLSDDVLSALRCRAVAAWEAGTSLTTIATILHLSREAVARWCSASQRAGIDGLPQARTGRPLGSGRWLSAAQAQHVQKLLLKHGPEKLGIAAVLWTRKAVRDLIHQEYDLRLPVRTVGLYLQRWGWTPQRPARKGYRQDPEEVRQWLEEKYPAMAARARAEGAEIHWGDETGVEADRQGGRGYAPRGATPERLVTGHHVRINMVSTVTNQGQGRFMLYEGKMNGTLFLVFLTRLLRGAKRKLFLIIDHLPAHMAALVRDWVAEHHEQMELFELPRYAPELNPDEYLNNDVKGNVNEEVLAKSQPELKARVSGFMHKLAKLPEHVTSYFEPPKVAYAAAH